MPLAAHVQGLSCKDHGGVSDPAPGQENCHRIQSSWFLAPCHHMSPPRAPTQLRLLPGKDAETTEVSFRGPISELLPDFSSRVEEGFQEKWGAFQLGSFSSHSWTPDILQLALAASGYHVIESGHLRSYTVLIPVHHQRAISAPRAPTLGPAGKQADQLTNTHTQVSNIFTILIICCHILLCVVLCI